MKKSTAWWLASLLALLALGGVVWMDESVLRAPPSVFLGTVIVLPQADAACNPVVEAGSPQGCSISQDGRGMRLLLEGDVRPLRPFTLRLKLPDTVRSQVKQASVDFVMLGMDMGINRYTLRQQSDGDLAAQVILPVCSVGRSDWVAQLSVVVGVDQGEEMWTWSVPFTAEPSLGSHD